MPATDADRALHVRLLNDDPIATAEAAEQFLTLVAARLRSQFPKLRDDQLLDEAAADALFSFLRFPKRFQPDKLGLLSYLVMSAAGDLRNKLAVERGRSAKRREYAVELLPDARNEEADAEMPLPSLKDCLSALFDDVKDRKAAALILQGVRSTDRFAELYGLRSLPVVEQRRNVKRHKDRIKKVLQRHGAETL